jgi:phage tail P2-like protein
MSQPKLQQFKFRDLLPTSVRDAEKFVAAAHCLDELLSETDAQVKNAIIYARIDELDEPLLSNLAWQFNLDGYEGYALAQTLDEKRALVKNAIQLKWHKGTRWSVERVFELLNLQGVIIEWWESDDPTFNPYEFDLDITTEIRPLNETFYSDVIRLVFALKNVRSHLRRIKIIMRLLSNVPVIGAASIGGINGIIRPYINYAVNPRGKLWLGCGIHGANKITVYPRIENLFYITGEMGYTGGAYGISESTVYPEM